MISLRNLRPRRLLGAGLMFGALGAIGLSLTPQTSEIDDGFIPLRYQLNAQSVGKLTIPFVTHWTDPHYFGIDLSPGRGDKDVDRYLDALSRFDIDDSLEPRFDVSWRVLLDGTVIDSGDGHRGQYGEAGHTFTLGRFRAEADKDYVLEFTTGKDFMPLLKGRPILEIGDDHAATSVGLALGRDIWRAARLPVVCTMFAISLLLVSMGVVLQLRLKSNMPN